jgi:hypothetical protein
MVRNGCDSRAIKICWRNMRSAEDASADAEGVRLGCAQRIQWHAAVEECGLVRRCSAQAKDV